MLKATCNSIQSLFSTKMTLYMCVYEDYVKRPKKLAKDKAEEKHQTPLQHRLEVLCFIHSSFFLPFYALSGNKQKQKKKGTQIP
jgi:hypothetical protein